MGKWFILSFIAGIASSTQNVFNGYWKDKLDLKVILLVNAVVFLIATLIYFYIGEKSNLKTLSEATPSIIVGGVSGFLIVLILTVTFPKIGAFQSVMFLIMGQLFSAILYDYFGVLNLQQAGISIEKIIGSLFILVGAGLVLK